MRASLRPILAIALAACGGGGGDADSGATTERDTGTTGVDAPRVDAPATPSDSGPQADAGPGGAAFRGAILFTESFEDSDLAGRGWYDMGGPVTLGTMGAPGGGSGSFRCSFTMGATTCPGRPGRHPVPETESVYFSYWVDYQPGWVGSGRPYHPHEFHFVTNQDGDYVGPAATHLTTYMEQVGLRPLLAIQDSLNVDPACVLRNDDSFVGCGGDFSTYPFTEMRSVASCNGLAGDVDGRDCFSTGSGWYSARMWRAPGVAFTTGTWHFVETYFRLNTIVGGIGQVDGGIRLWVDGALLVSSDAVLLRTGQHPTMRFDQFLSSQYIGDGSPIDQTVYYDELTIARGLP
jgi:hypothetical protein